MQAELPEALERATAHQPAARIALAAALRSAPSHAYLLEGPAGSGKREAARALAAEILVRAAADPDSTRRRALAVPSPHPDLVWIEPPGTQHLVEEVRERVIRAAAYRPFEGERRVFVIDEAEAMREESQNALLKTLEEPGSYAHFLLVSSEPDALLETIVSRCQPVRFSALPPQALVERLQGVAGAAEVEAAARLARGNERRARFLLATEGRELRTHAEACARAALRGRVSEAPVAELLDAAATAGQVRAEAVGARFVAELEAAPKGSREAGRLQREVEELGKRADRRARTEALDAALEVIGLWIRDLAVVREGVPELAFTVDRTEQLAADAPSLEPASAHEAIGRVAETRRRLALLNVGEELALEALLHRLALLSRPG